MNVRKISQIEFIQKLIPSIDKCSWFLGAGTSASANLPTATDIIWDLKKRHYCLQENQDIKNQDIQIQQIKNKIQKYSDSKGFPAAFEENEYSFYFELMFGEDYEAQRKYLSEVLDSQKIALSIGHRALAALMSNGTVKVVYTTNFDKVIENAYSFVCSKNLSSFHLEGAEACKFALNNNEFPLYAKVHGDFQYQKLANLSKDLQKADEEIRKCFIASSTRFGTVVAGYSGRDSCIMDLFNEAIDAPNAFPHGLYWTVLKNSVVSPQVTKLISSALAKGISAYIVEIDNFDSLMSLLWRNLSNRENDLDIKVQRNEERKVVIPLPQQSQKGPLLRFNALPLINLPTMCLKIETEKHTGWKELKEIKKAGAGKIISWIDENIYAWGGIDEIKTYFPNGSKISPVDISSQLYDLKNHKPFHSSLEELLCLSLADGKKLLCRKNCIIIAEDSFQESKFKKVKECVGEIGGRLPQTTITDNEGLEKSVSPIWSWSLKIRIKQVNEKYLLILSPDIWISPVKIRENYQDFLRHKRKQLKNDNMDRLLSAWIESIFQSFGTAGVISIKPDLLVGQEELTSFKTTTRTVYSRRAS